MASERGTYSFAAGILALVAISFLDMTTPRDYAVWLFYVLPIMILSWRMNLRQILTIVTLSSILTVFDFYFYFHRVPAYPEANMVNRILGVGIFWAIAFLIIEQKKGLEALRQIRDSLEQTVRDRTSELVASNEALKREIMEREKVQESLYNYTTQLRYLNKELESFTYSVSHDLRAPVRIANRFLKMISEEHGDCISGDAQHKFAVVQRHMERMDKLIQDLLALSRLDRQGIRKAGLDMNNLAREAFQEQLLLHPDRQIKIEICNLPAAFGDPLLIRQVFSNLISNAFKFTRLRKDPAIEVGGSDQGREKVYWVKDNGAGFNMNYSDRLFGVFQRLHPESQFQGTGIGLAIIRRIIRRHGGRVWAEGKENEGATFYFTLPADKARELNSFHTLQESLPH